MKANSDLQVEIELLDDRALEGLSRRIRCTRGGQDPIIVAIDDILTESDEDLLGWYLERYPTWPYEGFQRRASSAERLLAKVGKRLLQLLFTDRDQSDRQEWLSAPGNGAITISSGDPVAHDLPWEILHDGRNFLAIAGSSKRRVVRLVRNSRPSTPRSPQCLRPIVLFVTSRPFDTGFIDLRSVPQQILLDVDEHPFPKLDFEFLRPPTLDALQARLQDFDRPVSVIHFDGHGIHGPDGPALAFENLDGSTDAVSASRLGNVLAGSGVRVVALTACKSAATSKLASVGSIPHALIAAGVDGVVAMSHDLLVTTASKYSRILYRSLARGSSLEEAHADAQDGLARDQDRHETVRGRDAMPQSVQLQDWWIPRLFVSSTDPLRLVDSEAIDSDTGEIARSIKQSEPHGATYGRSQELHAIERLFGRYPIVVITGMIGIGKTRLLTECHEWFRRTRLFERCIFIGEGVDSSALEISEPAPVEVAGSADSTLVLIDIGQGGQARVALKTVMDYVGTRPDWRVIVAARGLDAASGLTTSSRNAFNLILTGLDKTAAFSLAAEQLQRLGIPPSSVLPYKISRLLDDGKYHPLALPLEIRRSSHNSLLAGRALVSLEEVEDHITRVRDAWRMLDQSIRPRLSFLALLRTGAREAAILHIGRLKLHEWNEYREILNNAGLVSASELDCAVPDVFINVHPAIAEVVSGEFAIDSPLQVDSLERYLDYYQKLSARLYYERSSRPADVRDVARMEMPNFLESCQRLLAQGRILQAARMCESVCQMCHDLGFTLELEDLYVSLSSAIDAGDEFDEAEWLIESGLAEHLLQVGDHRRAAQRLARLLERIEEAEDSTDLGPGSMPHGTALSMLARCMIEDKQIEAADRFLAQAETILLQNVRSAQSLPRILDIGDGYISLLLRHGAVLQELGRPSEAKAKYERAIRMARQLSNEDRLDDGLTKLADHVLENDRDYQRALALFCEVLDRERASGDDRGAGATLHSMAGILHRTGKLAEAEELYLESLAIDEDFGNVEGAGISYGALGTLALTRDNPAEAIDWFRRELSVFSKVAPGGAAQTKSLNSLASSYILLAVNAMNAGDQEEATDFLVKAQGYAEEALRYQDALSGSSNIWMSLHNLSMICDLMGEEESGGTYGNRAREAYASVPEHRAAVTSQLKQLLHLVADSTADGAVIDSRLDQEIDSLEQRGWDVGPAVREVLAGATDWHVLAEGLDLDDSLALLLVLNAAAANTGHSAKSDLPDFHSLLDVVRSNVPEPVQVALQQETGDLSALVDSLGFQNAEIFRLAIRVFNAHAWDTLELVIHRAFRGDKSNISTIHGALQAMEAGADKELLWRAFVQIATGSRDIKELTSGVPSFQRFAIERMIEISCTDEYHLPIRIEDGRLVGGSPALAGALNNLGVALAEASLPEEAEHFLKLALEIDRRNRGTTHPNVLRDLKSLAAVYTDQGKHEAAIELWLRIVTLEESIPGFGLYFAEDCGRLADSFFVQNQYVEAAKYYARAIALRSEDSPIAAEHFAQNVLRLFECYLRMDQYDEHLGLLQEHVEVCGQELGRCHDLVRQMYGLAARVLEREEGYAEAASIWAENVRCCESDSMVADRTVADEELAVYLGNLGRCYLAQGRPDEALKYFGRSYPLMKARFGLISSHAIIAANDCIGALLYLDDDDSAVAFVHDVIEELHAAVSVDDLNDATESLMRPFAHFERHKVVQDYLTEVMCRQIELHGEESDKTLSTLSKLAVASAGIGDHAQAITYLSRSLAIKERRFGEVAPDLEDVLHDLALCSYRMGDLSASAKWFSRLLPLVQATHGSNSLIVAEVLELGARVRAGGGDSDAARRLIELSLATSLKIGADESDILRRVEFRDSLLCAGQNRTAPDA